MKEGCMEELYVVNLEGEGCSFTGDPEVYAK